MAVGDQQKLITNIVATILNEPAQTATSFDWFINKHSKDHFGRHYATIDKIFNLLRGDKYANQSKRTMTLDCDAYFGGQYNYIFEFDEYQHFSSSRLRTLECYPSALRVNFSISEWKQLSNTYKDKATKYRKAKTTTDFDFPGGRASQRAYLDCFRDLLPEVNGLQPTVRISTFEVREIYTNNKDSCIKIERLLKTKMM